MFLPGDMVCCKQAPSVTLVTLWSRSNWALARALGRVERSDCCMVLSVQPKMLMVIAPLGKTGWVFEESMTHVAEVP